jgi:polysaccharide export outer membrane protein
MTSTWRAAVAVLILIGSIALAQDAPAQPAASSASDKSASDKTSSDKTASAKITPAASTSQAGPEYVIGPDDTLHIAVWREADLTASLPVRPDGKISLPLLDDVQAAGLTPKQLADSITEKLKKYVADPRVTVVVTAINSKRIFINGEVLHPGPMPMLPSMTVMQALSSAGLNQFAKIKGIYVLRTENGKQQKLPVNYKKLLKGEIEQNYPLQPGDTIVVP